MDQVAEVPLRKILDYLPLHEFKNFSLSNKSNLHRVKNYINNPRTLEKRCTELTPLGYKFLCRPDDGMKEDRAYLYTCDREKYCTRGYNVQETNDEQNYFLSYYLLNPFWFLKYKKIMLNAWEKYGVEEEYLSYKEISRDTVDELLTEETDTIDISDAKSDVIETIHNKWWRRIRHHFRKKKCSSTSCYNALSLDDGEDYCDECLENEDRID